MVMVKPVAYSAERDLNLTWILFGSVPEMESIHLLLKSTAASKS